MKLYPLFVGGIVAGLIIVAGEAILNLAILANEWDELFLRFDLPQPTSLIAIQGILKLLLLGILSVWLSITFKGSFPFPNRAGLVSGLFIWFLVWAWVQWGMLLAGFVTPYLAATTIAWGFVELSIAAWAGARIYYRLTDGKNGIESAL